jgi:hypothetical protein
LCYWTEISYLGGNWDKDIRDKFEIQEYRRLNIAKRNI